MNDNSGNHPLCEIPSEYPAGYPSIGTTPIIKTPSKPSKRTTAVTGRILAITFTNDHKKLKDAKDSFESDGKPYLPEPEWIVGAVNTPVTYTRGHRLKINVTVTVKPFGEHFKIIGDGGKDYLYFEKDSIQSKGEKQRFSLQAKGRLPRKITHITHSINWYIIGNGWRAELGSSGPHEIFVLWELPKELSSRKYSNFLTYERIKFLTSRKVAGDRNSRSDIARSVQKYLNDHLKIIWKSPEPPYSKGSQFWALLANNRPAQCFEGSTLMELMLRLLGIPAVQKSVHGTADPEKDYVTYHGNYMGLQERNCYEHGKENLYLVYGKRFQEGQGCCEVNKKLYTVFVKGNVIGTPSGNRTSARHVLLQLEKFWKQKQKYEYFQVWGREVMVGGEEQIWACTSKATDTQGVPDPEVPRPK